MTRDEFLAKNWPHALAVAQSTGVDPRIVMAQAGIESNWGQAAPNNNYFGVKDFSGNGSSQPTTEVVNGKTVNVSQPFAKYDSPEASFGGYAQLIGSNDRYKAFRSAPGYGAQIAELGKSGYATAPNYASTIDGVAKDLVVPSDVKPSALAMNVNGSGNGGNGLVAPTPAVQPDADLAGYGGSNPAAMQTAGIMRTPPSFAPGGPGAGGAVARANSSSLGDTVRNGLALMQQGQPPTSAPQGPATSPIHKPEQLQNLLAMLMQQQQPGSPGLKGPQIPGLPSFFGT